jgi:hypothetical protein
MIFFFVINMETSASKHDFFYLVYGMFPVTNFYSFPLICVVKSEILYLSVKIFLLVFTLLHIAHNERQVTPSGSSKGQEFLIYIS